MKTVLVIVVCLLLGNSFVLLGQNKIANEEEVIRLAEDFIKRNGFTDSPVDTSKVKLSYELVYDEFQSTSEIIKKRHNSLYPQAFYIVYKPEWKKWMVGFVYTTVKKEELDTMKNPEGRAVDYYEDIHLLKMEHKTPEFSFWKKL